MKIRTMIVGAIALVIANPVLAETLDNAAVVQLVQVGLGEEAIIAKINGTASQFDVTTNDLIKLKQLGVPSAVIAAMIAKADAPTVSRAASASIESPDPLVPHPSGVYLLADWLAQPKMQMIDATTSNQTKTGGFLGYALTGGLASMSFKTVIPNANAHVHSAKTRPTFYFYFDQANASLSEGNSFWNGSAVTSPAEFSLVRFKIKGSGREVKVGNFNIGGAKSGVMSKDQIPFAYDRIAPGVFKVVPNADLEPGEYGFVYSARSGGGGVGLQAMGAISSRIFDFSVGP